MTYNLIGDFMEPMESRLRTEVKWFAIPVDLLLLLTEIDLTPAAPWSPRNICHVFVPMLPLTCGRTETLLSISGLHAGAGP